MWLTAGDLESPMRRSASKVEIEYSFQTKRYNNLDVIALGDMGAVAYRNRHEKTEIAPTFDPLCSPTFFKRLQRGYPVSEQQGHRGDKTTQLARSKSGQAADLFTAVAANDRKPAIPRCVTAGGDRTRGAPPVHEHTPSSGARRCATSHGHRRPKAGSRRVNATDPAFSAGASNGVLNKRNSRGVHSVERFVWEPEVVAAVEKPAYSRKLHGAHTAAVKRRAAANRDGLTETAAMIRTNSSNHQDIWSRMGGTTTGTRQNRDKNKRSKDTGKQRYRGGEVTKTDFMLRDLEYCQAMQTPRHKREAFFSQYRGLGDTATPRVATWAKKVDHLPQMLQYQGEVAMDAQWALHAKNERVERVVQMAIESRCDGVMRVVLFRLLYAKNVLHHLLVWRENYGAPGVTGVNSGRDGLLTAAARALGTSRAVVARWKQNEIQNVIFKWFNQMRSKKRINKNQQQLTDKVLSIEDKADNMLVNLDIMIEATHGTAFQTSSLLGIEFANLFETNPTVEPEFRQWLFDNNAENLRRFEVEKQGGVTRAGLRSAARTYLEFLENGKVEGPVQFTPAARTKLPSKTRASLDKRFFRMWCSVVDSSLHRLGWAAGRTVSCRFVQFCLQAKAQPWRQQQLQLIRDAVMGVVLAHRLVSAKGLYNKASKTRKRPLTKPQLRKTRTVFDKFDENRSGYLTPEDLVRVLECLGMKTKLYNVQHSLSKIDKNMDGKVDFWEFAEMLAWGIFDMLEATGTEGFSTGDG